MDVLNLLREWNLKGNFGKVSFVGGDVVFGDQYAFSGSTDTAYRSKRGAGDYYVLESVVFALQNKSLDSGKYLPLCTERKIKPVHFVDRKVREIHARCSRLNAPRPSIGRRVGWGRRA